MFPRLQKRGPIEATAASPFAKSRSEFPRLQKRGPIEAALVQLNESDPRAFPRLQKRGPIEALRRQGTPDLRVSGFHAYKSVAPLKLRHLSARRGWR